MKILSTKFDSIREGIYNIYFVKQGKLFASSIYLFIPLYIYLFNVYYKAKIERKKYILAKLLEY